MHNTTPTTPGSRVTTLVSFVLFGVAASAICVMLVHARGTADMEGFSRGPPVDEMFEIVSAFERVLDRRPTERELESVTKRLRDDPTYSTGVLEHQLMLSTERKRRVATQTNALKTELEGLYSRQQVRLHVRAAYADAIGTTPSAEAERFLLQRYVDSGMDEHELIRLTKAISIVPLTGTSYA